MVFLWTTWIEGKLSERVEKLSRLEFLVVLIQVQCVSVERAVVVVQLMSLYEMVNRERDQVEVIHLAPCFELGLLGAYKKQFQPVIDVFHECDGYREFRHIFDVVITKTSVRALNVQYVL